MRVGARSIAVALASALLLLPLGGAETGSHVEREVRRLVASPAPALDDSVSWRVEVPLGVVACVSAHEAAVAPFFLKASGPDGAVGSPTPALNQGLILQGPATWTLTVDPALGAPVDVLVQIDGHFVDCANGPAAVTVTDLPSLGACAPEGAACLP